MQVLSVLSKVDDWQFDAFKLSEVSNNRPLSMLSFVLFKRSGEFVCLPKQEEPGAQCMAYQHCCAWRALKWAQAGGRDWDKRSTLDHIVVFELSAKADIRWAKEQVS